MGDSETLLSKCKPSLIPGRKMFNRPGILILFMSFLLLSGCGSGAVVFAPTPPPPDLTPLRYDHPSGVFSVTVPRSWSVYTQNTTTLVTAAFSPPGENDAAVIFAVINLDETLDATGLNQFIDRYQSQIRSDAGRYTEQNREAMGDGSWRITGLRRTPGGITQQINTFIEQTGTLIGVIDVIIPADAERLEDLQAMVNSFSIHEDAALEPEELTVLAYATSSELEAVHIATWTTASGVFFISGEVANYGSSTVTNLPVKATLKTQDGLTVIEAQDEVMGLGIPPGGFAPFSLRFGQGQPSVAAGYELTLGDAEQPGDNDSVIYGPDVLEWSDQSSFTEDGRLVIDGEVTNTGDTTVRNLRATLTVFDETQNVIAAAFSDIAPQLSPDESVPYQLVVSEIGGEPARYIVNIQAVP